MAKLKGSNASSDRQKWQKVFKALVHVLETQKAQIESIMSERNLLEDRIKLQHDQISQMKRQSIVREMERDAELSKSDLVLGLKQREASLNKLKLEEADSELEDFKAWFIYLSHKCSQPNDILQTGNVKDSGQQYKALESEVRKLRSENENLILNNNSEVAALLSEKNFVWNQYNRMEKEKTEQLRSKCTEVEQANEKIQKLLTAIENLQSSNNEKDCAIATLKTSMAKLEADSSKKSEEIFRLSGELELLRKSRGDSATPVLRRCRAETGTSRLGGKNSGMDRRNIIVKKELYSSQFPDHLKDSEKGGRSSKRKAVEIIPILETPKLFSSTFKVPKLKNSSSASHPFLLHPT